jgi:hypothetical protein
MLDEIINYVQSLQRQVEVTILVNLFYQMFLLRIQIIKFPFTYSSYP